MKNKAYNLLIDCIEEAKKNIKTAQLIVYYYGEEKDITQTIKKQLEEIENKLKTIRDILIKNY